MQVYIAMPEEAAWRVDGTQEITLASLMTLPNNIKYLPLKETREHALDAAMTGSAMTLPIAREITVWKILEINMPRATAFQMVQDGKLVRDINRKGWRLFDNLEFGSFSPQWWEVTVAPIGVYAWTERALMPKFQVSHQACSRCQKQTAVYRMHCGDCWLDWLKETQAEAASNAV